MTQKILIADDEPNIVVPLQFLMERNGYETVVAQSGEEALEAIAKEKPDTGKDVGLEAFDLLLEDRDIRPCRSEVCLQSGFIDSRFFWIGYTAAIVLVDDTDTGSLNPGTRRTRRSAVTRQVDRTRLEAFGNTCINADVVSRFI